MMAMQGNHHALKLLIERMLPVRRENRVRLKLVPHGTAADVKANLDTVLRQMGKGHLSPTEAEVVSRLLEAERKCIETVQMEERVAWLEDQLRPKAA